MENREKAQFRRLSSHLFAYLRFSARFPAAFRSRQKEKCIQISPPVLYYNRFASRDVWSLRLFLYFTGRAARSVGQINSYLPYCDMQSGRYLSPAGETGPCRMRTPFIVAPISARRQSATPDFAYSGDLLHIFESKRSIFYLWQKN